MSIWNKLMKETQDPELKEAIDLLEGIKKLQEESKEDVLSFCEEVPEEHFKFICYREHGLYFSSIYKIINSDYYLIIRSSDHLKILSNQKFSPLDNNKRFSLQLSREGESLESVLHLLPKKAGAFLCFHMDVIKGIAKIK